MWHSFYDQTIIPVTHKIRTPLQLATIKLPTRFLKAEYIVEPTSGSQFPVASFFVLGLTRIHAVVRQEPVLCQLESYTVRCETFTLPEGRQANSRLLFFSCLSDSLITSGLVHKITAQGDGSADQIFQEYQSQAADARLPFRRWPLRAVSHLVS